MKYIKHTTAIAAALGAMAFAAPAQAQEEMTVCDTPWQKVDDNEDGFVSQMEASGNIDVHFGQIDKDEDGNITRVEYVDCLASAENTTAVEAERTEQNFADADMNDDDQLDRREFSEAAKNAYEESRSASAEDDEAFVVLRRYVWLVPEEAAEGAMLQDMTMDEAAARSAMTFAALDENDDDIVDTQEWQESEPTSGRTQQWAEARFDEIDEDASGSVSKEEYRQARSARIDEIQTSSTDASSTGSTGTASTATDDQQSAAAEDSGSATTSEQGIPVYIYRFWTM